MSQRCCAIAPPIPLRAGLGFADLGVAIFLPTSALSLPTTGILFRTLRDNAQLPEKVACRSIEWAVPALRFTVVLPPMRLLTRERLKIRTRVEPNRLRGRLIPEIWRQTHAN